MNTFTDFFLRLTVLLISLQ